MKNDQVIKVFEDSGAILQGHFILSSGLHSRVFLQKSLIFKDPEKTSLLCSHLANLISNNFKNVELIVSPAIGGIVPGYETARHLGLNAIWLERELGVLELRRGFSLNKGQKVVIVEDVISTGKSAMETAAALYTKNVDILGIACLIDRRNVRSQLGYPVISLATFPVETFEPDNIPEDLKNKDVIKPGSRHLNS